MSVVNMVTNWVRGKLQNTKCYTASPEPSSVVYHYKFEVNEILIPLIESLLSFQFGTSAW